MAEDYLSFYQSLRPRFTPTIVPRQELELDDLRPITARLTTPDRKMPEAFPPEDDAYQFYISASGSPLEQHTRTLKHGNSFAIFDAQGDIPRSKRVAAGLFHRDTRYLSHLRLRINGERPLLLSSSVDDDNVLFTADLTNPDFHADGRLVLTKDMIHIQRAKFLWADACQERLTVRNYADQPQRITLELAFDADFADLFEVRGHRRENRGTSTRTRLDDGVALTYRGLDGITRETCVRFEPIPDKLEEHAACFELTLGRGERASLFMQVTCDQPRTASCRYFLQLRQAQHTRRGTIGETPSIETSNASFNEITARAKADLAMLTTDTEHGPYPYAGIPWFSAPFGRDGIITALETLWIEPQLAAGVAALSRRDPGDPGRPRGRCRAGQDPA
ncbi:MAG: glycogen debranching N-terminal domain-containing protein [Pseudomonadota bacterium]